MADYDKLLETLEKARRVVDGSGSGQRVLELLDEALPLVRQLIEELDIARVDAEEYREENERLKAEIARAEAVLEAARHYMDTRDGWRKFVASVRQYEEGNAQTASSVVLP